MFKKDFSYMKFSITLELYGRQDIWDSRWLTNMGVKHKQLEEELLRYLNTPNITLFTNGSLVSEGVIKNIFPGKKEGEV